MNQLKLLIKLPNSAKLSLPLAKAPVRLFAALIDAFIQMLLITIPSAAMSLLPQGISPWDIAPYLPETWLTTLQAFNLDSSLLSLSLLWSFVVYWFYNLYFELAWKGQSPGKRYLGLRVVREDLRTIGLSEAALRALLRPFDSWGFFAVGATSAFFTPLQQRLGDIAAGTVVIEDPKPRAKP